MHKYKIRILQYLKICVHRLRYLWPLYTQRVMKSPCGRGCAAGHRERGRGGGFCGAVWRWRCGWGSGSPDHVTSCDIMLPWERMNEKGLQNWEQERSYWRGMKGNRTKTPSSNVNQISHDKTSHSNETNWSYNIKTIKCKMIHNDANI